METDGDGRPNIQLQLGQFFIAAEPLATLDSAMSRWVPRHESSYGGGHIVVRNDSAADSGVALLGCGDDLI
jgi:hypothetical protein